MPAALPRVAKLQHAQPPRKPTTRNNDRFGGIDSIYAKERAEGPSALAYADSAASTLGKGPAASLGLGPSDRFAGHDSRYKKGLRKSTMPIHDPKVYETKIVDDSVPLPGVSNVPVAEKREIQPSNERFGSGTDSIYRASEAPAPTKYEPNANTTLAASSAFAGPSLDKQSERFTGPDSIYNPAYNGAPAVGKYDPTIAQDMTKSATSTLVTPFESGPTDRFAAGNSIYRRGLRRSTVPEQRDTSSFPAQPQGIGKRSGAARGAALKAALKATIGGISSELGAVAETEEVKENLA